MLQKTTKRRHNSRWSKHGIRISPARTVDVQYYEKKGSRWMYREEEMKETDFVLMFARDKVGFRKGARIF